MSLAYSLNRCSKMVKMVSCQSRHEATLCSVHRPHTLIHHLLLRGQSKPHRASEVKSSPRSDKVHLPPAICPTVVFYSMYPFPVLLLLLSTFSILTCTAECSHIAFAKGRREVDLVGCPIPPLLTLSFLSFSLIHGWFSVCPTVEVAKTKMDI